MYNIRNKFNYRGNNYVSTIELAKIFVIYTKLALKSNWKSSLWGFISGESQMANSPQIVW